MSRPARILSETGMYHVIFRGMNRQNIFEENEDRLKLLEIIKKVKIEKSFEIYAYCLMTNHVHLFIKENDRGEIKSIMHKILSTYVGWYNYKYQRSGSLIGNRYKSEPIEDDRYYLALVRYIHQNPLRAGMVENLDEYRWSSYKDYTNKNKESLTDIYFTLSILSENELEAKEAFKEFHGEFEYENFTISNNKKLTDEQIKRKIIKISGGILPTEISSLPLEERNRLLSELRKNGLSIGQLERLTGISRGIITRAKGN